MSGVEKGSEPSPADREAPDRATAGAPPADVEDGSTIGAPAPAVVNEQSPERRVPKEAVAPFDASALTSLTVADGRARPRHHVPRPDEPSVPELEDDETIAPRPEEEIADVLRAKPDVGDHGRHPT